LTTTCQLDALYHALIQSQHHELFKWNIQHFSKPNLVENRNPFFMKTKKLLKTLTRFKVKPFLQTNYRPKLNSGVKTRQ
jgi:hypothetical protein